MPQSCSTGRSRRRHAKYPDMQLGGAGWLGSHCGLVESAKVDVGLGYDAEAVATAGLVCSMPGLNSARGTSDGDVGRSPMRARLLSLLLRPTPPPLSLGLVVAASLIVAETLVLYPLTRNPPAPGAVYLLGVLVIAVGWGFWLAAATAVVSALAFDYFYIPPVFTLTTPAQDAVAIAVFLVVALSVSTLADLARSRTIEAEQRRREADLARAQLTASRARIVAAGDEARRRLERNIHDGAQQRLVSLGLELRGAETLVPAGLHQLKEQISGIVAGLARVSLELQEISRGIHPAILSTGGLGPALNTLARSSTVPVQLDVGLQRQLPEDAKVAAYYVVAEALTNAAKHARASQITVKIEADRANLRLSIRDDGIGGADAANGSGLTGLRDRVEALDGAMAISSQPGNGTSLLVTIPLQVESPMTGD
jgi:signal transduction histidine kinase